MLDPTPANQKNIPKVSAEAGRESGVPINLSETLVLTKESKLEWDSRALKLSFDEVLAHYDKSGADADTIKAAHDSHLETIRLAASLGVNASNIFSLHSLRSADLRKLISETEAVILIGGDDHIKQAAIHIKDKLVLPINSDPQRSVGALCTATGEDLERSLASFKNGDYSIELWQRLRSQMRKHAGGKLRVVNLPPALSEISIADKRSIYTFRGAIRIGEKTSPVKGSGLLIATGSGSTGWFNSAGRYLFHAEHAWDRKDPRFEVLVREPYGDLENVMLWETLDGDQSLKIVSSSNNHPEVSIDSVKQFKFVRGSSLVVSTGDAIPIAVLDK